MKNILTIIFCLLMLCSCKLYQFNKNDFTIYKKDKVGEIFPEYLIIENVMNRYELFCPYLHISVFGSWSVSNDTLFLSPLYEYRNKICKIEPTDSTFYSIHQKYLVNKKNLYDITDYKELTTYFVHRQKRVFKRIK